MLQRAKRSIKVQNLVCFIIITIEMIYIYHCQMVLTHFDRHGQESDIICEKDYSFTRGIIRTHTKKLNKTIEKD